MGAPLTHPPLNNSKGLPGVSTTHRAQSSLGGAFFELRSYLEPKVHGLTYHRLSACIPTHYKYDHTIPIYRRYINVCMLSYLYAHIYIYVCMCASLSLPLARSLCLRLCFEGLPCPRHGRTPMPETPSNTSRRHLGCLCGFQGFRFWGC